MRSQQIYIAYKTSKKEDDRIQLKSFMIQKKNTVHCFCFFNHLKKNFYVKSLLWNDLFIFSLIRTHTFLTSHKL